jgi:hypothetical protein
MQFYSDRVTDQYGNVKASASVRVLLNGSLATIYSDDGITTKANPITTGSDGSFSFYAANGTYTLSVSGAQAQTVTLLDYTDVSTAVPSGSATVLGEDGGTVKRFALGQPLSLLSYGVARDGTTDDAAAINTAFAAAAAAGRTLLCPAGNYLVSGATLKLVSGLHVVWERGAVILNRKPVTGDNGFVEQADILTKITDVSWKGGKISGLDITNSKGNTFFLYGDRIRIEGVEIDGFGGPGRAIFISGDDNTVRKCHITGPFGGAGSGGIRMAGGTRFRGLDNYVHSGDDALQFVTGEAVTGTASFFDQDITDSTYANCIVISDEGRCCIAIVNDATSSMAADLTGCTFNNIIGESAGAASAIKLGAQTAYGNGHTGTIQDLAVIGGYFKHTGTATQPVVNIEGSDSSPNAVTGMKVLDATLVANGSDVETVRIEGYNTGTVIRGCTIRANTNVAASDACIWVEQGTDAQIVGNTIYQGVGQALRTPNNLTFKASGLVVKDNVFLDCRSAVVYDNYTENAVYSNNTFRKLSGGASATGITLTANSVTPTIHPNTYVGIETPLSSASTTAKIFDNVVPTTTFTPTLSFATAGDLSVSYTTQVGNYAKVGNLVHGQIVLVATPTYTTTSGVLQIGGLPYTAKQGSNIVQSVLLSSHGANLTYPTSCTTVVGRIAQNTKIINLRGMGSGAASADLTTANAASGAQQSLSLSFTYLAEEP